MSFLPQDLQNMSVGATTVPHDRHFLGGLGGAILTEMIQPIGPNAAPNNASRQTEFLFQPIQAPTIAPTTVIPIAHAHSSGESSVLVHSCKSACACSGSLVSI